MANDDFQDILTKAIKQVEVTKNQKSILYSAVQSERAGLDLEWQNNRTFNSM